MILEKFSFGTGDRFGQEGKALLAAVMRAKQNGVNITPVWNKSHREHSIIGTKPADTRKEADEAVKACGWSGPYFVDADHINLNTVDLFVKTCDFFTLDVAHFIAKTASETDVAAFIRRHSKYIGQLFIDGMDVPFDVTEERIRATAGKFLLAIRQAGAIYRRIEAARGAGSFITEISLDETTEPQTPVELFFILAAVADERIPLQAISPRFVGRFNKGVDYAGSVAKFARQFEDDIAVVTFAAKEFGLPANLKLSLHSASDKFSIYGPINKALKKFNAGLHVKTAGTTWLEELAALAAAGGDGLAIAKKVYAKALSRIDELCRPYATVIDIDSAKLPAPQEVEKWDGARFAAALRHDKSCADYNPHFRQLMHVAYRIAAEMGRRYLDALKKYEKIIAQNVTENIYEKHIKPLFLE